jgi:hypothetical protein
VLPSRLVFRIPGVAVLGALLIAVAATPIVVVGHWLFLIYLIPLAAIAFILRTRTTADGEGLVVRTVLTNRTLPWSGLKGLRLTKRSGVRAVLTDDREVALPSVRTRHLPALSLISGGRLDDPTAEVAPTEATQP